VGVYAVNFDPQLAGVAASIAFDAQGPTLATTTLAACDNNRGAGFGIDCNGQTLDVTIPPDATAGTHHLVLRLDLPNSFVYQAALTVDTAPTPTATPTATDTDTPTEAATSTATGTATGTSSATIARTATRTATGSATADDTPSWTPTPPRSGSTATPTATGAPTATGTATGASPAMITNTATGSATADDTPSWTPTATPSQPSAPPSIAVRALQRVQGGCAALPGAAVVPGDTLSNTAIRGGAAVKGGQSLRLDAAHLPADTALDLVIIAPRAVVSGRVSTTVDYSPPVTQARTDNQGNLHSAVALPDDLGTGPGTVQAFLHTARRGSAHPTLLTTWGFRGAPRDPVLQVSVRDASGMPMRGASVTFFPSGSTSQTRINLAAACGRTSDSSGGAVFSRVPAGSGQLIVSRAGAFIGSAAPIARAGSTVRVTVSDRLDRSPSCVLAASSDQYLWDEESGGSGASSGEGPFGTFISGVRAMDSFSAFVLPETLRRNMPITLSFVDGQGASTMSVRGFGAPGFVDLASRRSPLGGIGGRNSVVTGMHPASSSSRGPRALHAQGLALPTPSALLVGSAASPVLRLRVVTAVTFPPVDLGRLPPGDWSVRLSIGSNPDCPAFYSLRMIKNPWETPFGAIHPIYDRVDHAYYASGSLPNSGPAAALLHFQQPHVRIGWDRFRVAKLVTIPGLDIPFPELASSDLGLDVNERLFTDGRWDGSLSAHAHVKMLGISLLDSQLPTFYGSGRQITRDDVPLFEYPAVSNQPLFSMPLVGGLVGFPGVADAVFRVTFNMHGSVDVRLGVGAVLNRVSFTFDPAVSAGLEAEAHVDFLGSSAGLSLNGAVTLQAPVTVAIPGGIHANLAVRFGVGGHAWLHICYGLGCSRSSANFTIIPQFCVLGDCSAVANLVYRAAPAPRGGPSAAARGAGLAMAGSRRVSARSSLAPRAARQPTRGATHAATSSYPAQPALAISPAGHSAALWVSNAGGRVRLLAAMDGGPSQTIAASDAQLAAPRVAWIGQDRAVAVWVGATASAEQIAALTSTSAPIDGAALAAALSRQEIYSSVWDGRAWSAPGRLTKDSLADGEPAVTADIRSHVATLVWVHATDSASVQSMLQATELRVSRYVDGQWTPATTFARARAGGLHSPTIGSDGAGQVTVAWVAGSGMAATTLVAPYVNGATTHPQTIPGLGIGAVQLSLAFDGDGHPVVVADGVALTVARSDSSGHWTVWTLGPGSQPQLASERDGAVAFSSLPGAGDPLLPLGVPSLRILPRGGTFGSPLTVPGTSNRTIAFAIAADPRTGAVEAIEQTTTAASEQALDADMHVALVTIAAGGQLSLVPDGISLDPPQPRPGARARVLITVRNTGFTTLQPGEQVVVRVDPSRAMLRLRLARALAPGTTAILAGKVIAAQTELAVTARIGAQTVRVVLARPPSPTALGSAPRPQSGGLQLDWTPAADSDVTTYRVYRGVGPDGPLSLAGIATSMLWLDTTRAPGMAYRYQVTAVDAYGRESSLSAALITMAARRRSRGGADHGGIMTGNQPTMKGVTP